MLGTLAQSFYGRLPLRPSSPEGALSFLIRGGFSHSRPPIRISRMAKFLTRTNYLKPPCRPVQVLS